MTALRPFKRETMVNHYGEDPSLLERRQRRSQLADDLLEDIVDDSEIEDTTDEPGEASLEGQPAIAEDEDTSPVRLVSTRSPIEMEEWGEAPDKLDEVEPEVGDIEVEEGIDDPVRMYLREIGKVSLLTADDEKRLARSMEESDYIHRLENAHFEKTGRNAKAVDVLVGLLSELQGMQKAVDLVVKNLGLQKVALPELIVHDQFRKLVDAEMDLEMAAKLAAGLKIEEPDAERMLVRMSILTHILTQEMVTRALEAAGKDAKATKLPPLTDDLAEGLAQYEDRFRPHFQRLKEEGFQAEKRLTE